MLISWRKLWLRKKNEQHNCIDTNDIIFSQLSLKTHKNRACCHLKSCQIVWGEIKGPCAGINPWETPPGLLKVCLLATYFSLHFAPACIGCLSFLCFTCHKCNILWYSIKNAGIERPLCRIFPSFPFVVKAHPFIAFLLRTIQREDFDTGLCMTKKRKETAARAVF